MTSKRTNELRSEESKCKLGILSTGAVSIAYLRWHVDGLCSHDARCREAAIDNGKRCRKHADKRRTWAATRAMTLFRQ